MSRKLLPILAATCLVATPALAKEGFYAGLSAGVNIIEDSDVGGTPVEIEYDTGYAILGTLGYSFSDVWSVGDLHTEFEFSYRQNDFDKLSTPLGSIGLNGDVSQLFGMINVLADFDTGTAVRPYVGAGIGWGQVRVSDLSVPGLPGSFDDEDEVFAFQPIIGVSFEVTPQITLLADYRYFFTNDPDIGGSDVEIRNHTIMVGARYHF